MKSPEVYSQLKSELSAWFKSTEFQRIKGLLGWSRPHGAAHVVVWFQVSQDGWDPYTGSKFIVELQRSIEPIVGSKSTHRQRLASFLSQEGREQLRSIQNKVIATLQRPPRDYPKLHISPEVTDWYLNQFKLITEPYPERHDIWFRYASPDHITQWIHFITSQLPACVSAAEGWANTINTSK